MPPPPLKKQKRQQQQYRIDFTKKLFSDEIILNIFSYLTATDLINCEKVNKTWYRLANDTFALWRPLYEEKFDKPLNHFKAKWASSSQVQIANHKWKDLYRINHNWLSGHCTSTQLNININLNISNAYNNNTQRFIQYTHDVLCFINQDSTKIEIWQLQNTQPTHIYTIMDEQLFQPQQHTITCLKLKKSINNNNKKKKNSFTLIVGTSHAQYMIWELIINKNECKPLLLYQKNYNYHHSCQEKDAVIAMDICDNIITFCTESMKLEYYDVSYQPPRLIYHLQSNVHWSPIILQLNRKKSTTSSSSHQWCALLFFGMHIGLNASSIGVQEMILSKNTLISSRHCSILCQDQLFFTNRTTTATSSRVDPPMTSMIYSEPFLMTSHSNNTIKQYRFYHHDTTSPSLPSIKKSNITINAADDFRLSYVQTLFGHTSQVNYLAMDASQGRLVSGDRYGLKMWDLLSLDQCKVRGNDYMVNLKYNDDDDDQQQQHITTTHHMKWLQMDHDKIMGLLMDNHNPLPYFKIWSFDL
ncbi:hypothetical protein BJ944DRAFT_84924 [Cunninghamella echinulata]|nr:hypothetical protein BJ944DRAFT_84924 [Cunninghamella echinulata]